MGFFSSPENKKPESNNESTEVGREREDPDGDAGAV